MGQKPQRRYSEAFKMQVISELESGKVRSQCEAKEKFGISGNTTIQKWLKKYGKQHLIPGVLRVEKPGEADRFKELQKELKRTKEALANSHLDAVLYRSWFKVACREFGVQDIEAFKKKLENQLVKMSIEEKDPEDKTVTVRALCLRTGISRQAFYKGEKERQRHEVDAQAVVELVKAERKLQPSIGTRKLHVMFAPVLEEMGIAVGRDRLFGILREENLLVEPRPARAQTTDSRHLFHMWPNLLRQIEPTMAHQVWVGDLTYVRTSEGFLYLSLLTDGYSRKIVGYHANDTLEAEGCLKTLKMAIKQLPDGAAPIHHTDRGIQYCCNDYIGLLQQHQIAVSMTEMNHCYENAKAERVNGILKGEYGLGSTFQSKRRLKAIDQAIALYNGRRPHQLLGYRVPAVVHAEAA